MSQTVGHSTGFLIGYIPHEYYGTPLRTMAAMFDWKVHAVIVQLLHNHGQECPSFPSHFICDALRSDRQGKMVSRHD